MAGETEKSRAVCLSIRPWSRTSHVVGWLTPRGKVVCDMERGREPRITRPEGVTVTCRPRIPDDA